MTLDRYKAAVQPSLTAHQTLATLSDQTEAALITRDQADGIRMTTTLNVVKSVVGGMGEGDDGEFYSKAMGYIPKSERKSGLSRAGGTLRQQAHIALSDQHDKAAQSGQAAGNSRKPTPLGSRTAQRGGTRTVLLRRGVRRGNGYGGACGRRC